MTRVSRRALLASGSLALAGCARAHEEYFGKTDPPRSQRLVYLLDSEPTTLDPTLTEERLDALILSLFEGLTSLHPDTDAPMSALATHYLVTADGLHYTFFLRGHPRPRGNRLPDTAGLSLEYSRGRTPPPDRAPACWSDGVPIHASDFVYSWRRALDPSTAADYALLFYHIRNAREINAGKLAPEHLAIRALDDFTLEVDLANPAPFFLELVSGRMFCPVPRHVIRTAGSHWTEPGRIVTSGAFVLRERRPYDRIVLAKSSCYYDAGQVALQELIFLVVGDPAPQLNLYKAGMAAIAQPWIPTIMPTLRHKKDFRPQPNYASEFFAINTRVPPLDDVRVRYALNMATDKHLIADLAGAGSLPAHAVAPPAPGPAASTGRPPRASSGRRRGHRHKPDRRTFGPPAHSVDRRYAWNSAVGAWIRIVLYRMPRELLLLCCLVSLAGGQDDRGKLLQRLRERVRETIERLPNYLCTETVDRTQSRASGSHPASCASLMAQKDRKLRPVASDRLRLDVAMSSNGEMYSWAGEAKFHDQTLGELVKAGTTATGTFATFLHAIFLNGAAQFSFQGERTEDGRTVAEFAYRVAQKDSQYVFGYSGGKMITGYHGTFLADPRTADLLRLVIDTDLLPDFTESCQASSTMDYHHVNLHGSDFLLPSEVRLRIVDTDGGESENRTAFSACHEFLGESTLSFDDPEQAAAGSARGNAAPTTLPAGLRFEMALTDDIQTATAAAGDAIHAKLLTPIRDHSTKVLVPAGTVVTGRISELRHYYSPSQSWSIGLRLDTIKVDGLSRPLAAAVDTLGQKVTGSRGDKGILHWSATPGLGAVVFSDLKPNEVIPAGQEMKWVTVWPLKAPPPKTELHTVLGTNPMPPEFRLEDPTDSRQPPLRQTVETPPASPRNLDLQEGTPGSVPPGWHLPPGSVTYSAELRATGCKSGPRCAVVLVPPDAPAGSFGNLMQSFDARQYRGLTVRLHAWLRVDPVLPGNRAQLWLRTDRQNGPTGFSDNMEKRAVTSGEWTECQIQGRIDVDATMISFGVLAFGSGGAWIDGIGFEIVPEDAKR